MEQLKIDQTFKEFNLFELIGVILGDGCILNYPDKHVYGLEITGNAYEEIDYYVRISQFIEALVNKKPRLYIKKEKLGKSLKIVVYGKKVAHYLIYELGICSKNKTFSGQIPVNYLGWEFSHHIIRGLFETDGSIYFSKSRGVIGYPRLEIKTSSVKLAMQVISLLEQKNFKPHVRTDKLGRTFAIYLSGVEMLEKWRAEIGFGSLKNLTKYRFWKKFGYYVPRLSLQDRLRILHICTGSQAVNY